MTRLWTDGAELGDILFWDVPGGAAFISSSSPRSGNYCYRGYSSSGTSGVTKLFGANLSEFYIRMALKNGVSSGYPYFAKDGVSIFYMNWDVYSRPTINLGLIGYPILTLPGIHPKGPVWNLYEIHYKVANSGGRIEVKQNGILEIDYTGDTQPGAETDIDAVIVHLPGSHELWLDDLALNDTSGAADNSWCSDGHIEFHPADDNGDVNAWMGNDADKVDNYQLVDEIPSDGDTTFVYSNTASEQDMYGVTDFDDTNKIVTRVWAEARARDANSLSGQVKLGFKTGGTVYLSAAARTLSSLYTKIIGDDAVINPKTSAVWDKTDLDAIQFVVENE